MYVRLRAVNEGITRSCSRLANPQISVTRQAKPDLTYTCYPDRYVVRQTFCHDGDGMDSSW